MSNADGVADLVSATAAHDHLFDDVIHAGGRGHVLFGEHVLGALTSALAATAPGSRTRARSTRLNDCGRAYPNPYVISLTDGAVPANCALARVMSRSPM